MCVCVCVSVLLVYFWVATIFGNLFLYYFWNFQIGVFSVCGLLFSLGFSILSWSLFGCYVFSGLFVCCWQSYSSEYLLLAYFWKTCCTSVLEYAYDEKLIFCNIARVRYYSMVFFLKLKNYSIWRRGIKSLKNQQSRWQSASCYSK